MIYGSKKKPKKIDTEKVKSKALKGERLTCDERRAVVRDYMLEYPRIERYGYNKAIINHFKNVLKIDVAETDICRDIDIIGKEWQNSKEVLYNKAKVIKMYERIAEETTNPMFKIAILREISKIEGIVKDHLEVSGGIANLTEDELKELKAGLKKNKD